MLWSHSFTCHSTYFIGLILSLYLYRSMPFFSVFPFRRKIYAKRLNKQTKCHEMQSKLKSYGFTCLSKYARTNIDTSLHFIKKNFKIWNIACVLSYFCKLSTGYTWTRGTLMWSPIRNNMYAIWTPHRKSSCWVKCVMTNILIYVLGFSQIAWWSPNLTFGYVCYEFIFLL